MTVTGPGRVRVLIVDDSAFSRRILRDILARHGCEVVGMARDGAEAVEMVLGLRPDVVTLDVDMPRQDGLTTLKTIMARCPTPVVMVSARTQEAAPITLACLEAGAVDCIPKLSGSQGLDLRDQERDLAARVIAAARARLRRGGTSTPGSAARPPRRPADPAALPGVRRCVALGASTGGPRNVVEMLARLPADLPAPVVYVQHMPAQFIRSYAARIDQVCPLRCKVAEDGEELLPGTIYLAPGDVHLVVIPPLRAGGWPRVKLTAEPANALFRPSVDVMMTSVARVYGTGAVGVLMTGMGRDGAAGMKAIRLAGGHTIAESEETAVIFGMPAAAIEEAAAEVVLPDYRIAEAIVEGVASLR
ncbi:protein-glutamate methylesterase/protein-glutamine glutaminase [Caldinitratiruptor microaerophilus]|uniref:Protein-glutamate methylesterase/protein-glutamine glutaminase n=1 Tax=Caldinitratiruptor microaerophilus TaxID=671077 RepID=A0AA35CKS0_9FIRM|nr:chemotaxis response regulator protein-glutamate methylesterase [Caldinitratiruptor microaerophilus]BDG60339.1 chemotaxis response regulator protein-glutamate methylesterase [Caldinitratiruptor microaerophilus]